MQISVDIRDFDTKSMYGRFVIQTLSQIVRTHTQNSYLIYTNISGNFQLWENAQIISTKLRKKSLLEQSQFRKVLEKDTSNLYIFFDEFIPLGFSKEFINIIPDLQEVFFPKLKFIKKYIYQRYLHTTAKKSQKILCFDTNTKRDLNEKVNVREEQISVIPGFFNCEVPEISTPNIKLDIRAKHNIAWEYLIYDSGNDPHHNFERVLKILARLKKQDENIILVIICEDTTKDVELRNKVLEYGIEKMVLFLWAIETHEEVYYYEQSLWVIFPWFYSSFPFHFWKAIMYQTPIITNELKAIKEIMQQDVCYFNSKSTSEACEKIQELLTQKKNTLNYKKLQERLTPENTVRTLAKVIQDWEQDTWK